MLQLVLTGLVGIALGVVIMRLMQKPGSPPTPEAPLNVSVDGDPSAADNNPNPLPRFSRNQIAFGGAGAMMLVAVGVMAFRPIDAASDTISTAAPQVTSGTGTPKGLDDVDTMISRLAERLKTDTTDGEGFRMLGWSYVNTGHPDDAVTAYEKAIKLLPNRADAHAGYGEAMVAVAKDVVTPDAKAQFSEALRLDPKEPRARFFMSLYKSQNGQERLALDEWIALSNSANADQPWQVDLRQRIDKLAKKLNVDISNMLKAPIASAPITMTTAPGGGPDAATMKAAAALPPSQQQDMIDGMVSGLAAKLQANPDNVDGWIKLIRSRVALKDTARAKDDLDMARKAFASNPTKLGQINATAKELGL
ncbi:MAG: tetratricopeptide repeat protein [Chakrabartia sp.]